MQGKLVSVLSFHPASTAYDFRDNPRAYRKRVVGSSDPKPVTRLSPDPTHLLFDEAFTNGLRTREVARALRTAGAIEVSQVVLARQPFKRA